jgi:hypothetical protein
MTIHRRRLLQLTCVALLTAPAITCATAQDYFDLGHVWLVHEQTADGQSWDGEWRRRGDTNTFDAEWRNNQNGAIVTDVIEFRSIKGNSIVLYRQGNQGKYFGDLAPGAHRTVRGTASWYSPGSYWTARIRGH